MAFHPLRNKALGIYKAAQCWAFDPDLGMQDLVGGPNLLTNAGSSGHNPTDSWQDDGRHLAAGERLYPAVPVRVDNDGNGTTTVIKFMPDPAAAPGQIQYRTLAVFFTPQLAEGPLDSGAIITLAHDGDTDELVVYTFTQTNGEAWSGSGTLIGKGATWGNGSIYLVGGGQDGLYGWGVWVPGMPVSGIQKAHYSYGVSLFDVGGTQNIAALRPDVVLPVEIGDAMDVGVMLVASMPLNLSEAKILELIKVDSKGYVNGDGLAVAPEDNASAVLSVELPAFDQMMILTDASKIGAPGPYDRMLMALVDPLDQSIFEHVLVAGVDVVEKIAVMVRRQDGGPPRLWPVGTLLRGVLTHEYFRAPAPAIVPGGVQAPSPLSSAKQEITLFANIDGMYAGMRKDFEFAKSQRFVVTSVGVLCYAGPVTGAQVSFGYGAGEDAALLPSTALTLASADSVAWFSDFPSPKASQKLSAVVVAPGSTGGAIRFLIKGFLYDM